MRLSEFFWIETNCIFTGKSRTHYRVHRRGTSVKTDYLEYEMVYYVKHKRRTNWYTFYPTFDPLEENIEGARAVIKYKRTRPYIFKLIEWIEEE